MRSVFRFVAALALMAMATHNTAMAQQDFFGKQAPAATKKSEASKRGNAKKVSLPDKPNVTDAKGLRQGEWAQKYSNGQYKYVATFKDGRPVGSVIRYAEDGKKTVSMTYDADTDTCRVITYHENGRMASQGQYFDQKREGYWKIYDTEGHLLATDQYSAGRRHGLQTIRFDNGKVSEMITWVDGVKSGEYLKFYPDGSKHTVASYRNDEFEGHYCLWGDDGKVLTEGNYVFGIKVGRWTQRFSDPDTVVVSNYDKYGRADNQNVLDSIRTQQILEMEKKCGTIPDPADYMDNPEEYVRISGMQGF